jgi:hypothetical protein
MERCWLIKPEDRPQFTQALRELEIIKEDEMVSLILHLFICFFPN